MNTCSDDLDANEKAEEAAKSKLDWPTRIYRLLRFVQKLWCQATVPVALWRMRWRQKSKKRGITAMSVAEAKRYGLIKDEAQDAALYPPELNASLVFSPLSAVPTSAPLSDDEMKARSRRMREVMLQPPPVCPNPPDAIQIIQRLQATNSEQNDVRVWQK